jgi:hypothetical protein
MLTEKPLPMLLVFLAALLAAAGCLQSPPEREDEIARTQRMIADAERTMRGGPGTPGAPGASSNVLVRIERLRVSAGDAAGLSAMWKYADGRVAVSGSDGLARGGVRLAAAGPDFQARLGAWQQKARSLDRASDEIVVQSGAEGSLWFGKSSLVPVLRIAAPSGEAVVLEKVEVAAHLLVRPRILDDGKIELQVSPAFLVRSGDRKGETLAAGGMSTHVTVEPGQRLVLGAGSSASQGSVASGLFGFDSRGASAATLVVLTAERL